MEDIWFKLVLTSGMLIIILSGVANITGDYEHKRWQQVVVIVALISAVVFLFSAIMCIWW